jgi:hemolysin III
MTTDPQEAAAAALAYVKPRLRGWLHAATSPAVLACAVVLIVLAPTGLATAAAAAFGVTSVVLFTTSAVYHRGRWSARADRWLKRIDHANIFLLIAGSYTPFAVLALDDEARVAVLASVWAAAIAGAVFRMVWVDAPRWLYVAFYLGLGWAAGIVAPQLLHGAGAAAFILVGIGGACYTLGGVVYGLQRPDPSPRWFGFHEVFHSLTLAAFVVHYVGISLVAYKQS